jgi:hypothetical protein
MRYIVPLFGIFYGPMVFFVVIWHIFPHFGKLKQEKSGNPGVAAFLSPKNKTK